MFFFVRPFPMQDKCFNFNTRCRTISLSISITYCVINNIVGSPFPAANSPLAGGGLRNERSELDTPPRTSRGGKPVMCRRPINFIPSLL